MKFNMALTIVLVAVLLASSNSRSVCKTTCHEEADGDDTDHNTGDHPIARLQSIEKTDQRIEVEIASTILVETNWYGFSQESEAYHTEFPFMLRADPSVAIWEHTRIENGLILTTAGIAMTDRNLTNTRGQLYVIGSGGAVSLVQEFIWGAQAIDVSRAPFLVEMVQSYTRFEEGEEVEVRAAVGGTDFAVMAYFYPSLAEPYEAKDLLGLGHFQEKDAVEGVKVNVEVTFDEEERSNVTAATLSVTDTGTDANWGVYSFMLYDSGSTISFWTIVLPKDVMSLTPQGEMEFGILASGGMSEQGYAAGISQGQQGAITCYAYGYPIDDIRILRVNPERAYVEKHMNQEFAQAIMYLPEVQEADAGTYWCVVSSYDRIFEKEFTVDLVEPLETELELLSQTNEEYVMKCTARGHPLPSVSIWRDEGWNSTEEFDGWVEIQDGGIYDITMTSLAETGEVTLVMTVSEQITDYSEHYKCKATDGFGNREEWLSVYGYY